MKERKLVMGLIFQFGEQLFSHVLFFYTSGQLGHLINIKQTNQLQISYQDAKMKYFGRIIKLKN